MTCLLCARWVACVRESRNARSGKLRMQCRAVFRVRLLAGMLRIDSVAYAVREHGKA